MSNSVVVRALRHVILTLSLILGLGTSVSAQPPEGKILQKGKIIRLTKRVWLGEMSFLRDEVTSADVLTEPTKKVKLLIWNKYDINELQKKQPIVIEKLRYIIANSLAEKIRYSNTLIESTFT